LYIVARHVWLNGDLMILSFLCVVLLWHVIEGGSWGGLMLLLQWGAVHSL
jgi:hypothetical protein